MYVAEIKRAALEEIEAEDRRKAIDVEKVRIRERQSRSWLERLIPWRIIIVRRNT